MAKYAAASVFDPPTSGLWAQDIFVAPSEEEIVIRFTSSSQFDSLTIIYRITGEWRNQTPNLSHAKRAL